MDIEELCYDVIGAAMAVHRHFGPGYLEEVYKNALMVELNGLGIQAEKEIPITVNYKGVRVGDYRADIIVENRLILELKAVTAINSSHEAQLVNYLNATGIDDGLLINFGAASLQRKHKYRLYRQPQALNPVNPVNPVQNLTAKAKETELPGRLKPPPPRSRVPRRN